MGTFNFKEYRNTEDIKFIMLLSMPISLPTNLDTEESLRGWYDCSRLMEINCHSYGLLIPPLCPWSGDKPATFLDVSTVWNQASECLNQTLAENMTGSTTNATRTPELPCPCMT